MVGRLETTLEAKGTTPYLQLLPRQKVAAEHL
jgi:hypothetical protein